MRYTSITQIGLILISLVIIFTFIKPMLTEIKLSQDELSQYSEAVSKATELNAQLKSLVARRNSFSQQDIGMLEKFIPSSIDTLGTMKNIENIFSIRNIPLTSLQAKEEVVPLADTEFVSDIVVDKANEVLNYQDFELTFSGSYQELKDILVLLESNITLLEVVDLSFASLPEVVISESDTRSNTTTSGVKGGHVYQMTLRTYGLNPSSI